MEIPERQFAVYGNPNPNKLHVRFMQFHDEDKNCTHTIHINYNKKNGEYERCDCLDTKGELKDPIEMGCEIVFIGTFDRCIKIMVMNLLILKGD